MIFTYFLIGSMLGYHSFNRLWYKNSKDRLLNFLIPLFLWPLVLLMTYCYWVDSEGGQ